MVSSVLYCFFARDFFGLHLCYFCYSKKTELKVRSVLSSKNRKIWSYFLFVLMFTTAVLEIAFGITVNKIRFYNRKEKNSCETAISCICSQFLFETDTIWKSRSSFLKIVHSFLIILILFTCKYKYVFYLLTLHVGF